MDRKTILIAATSLLLLSCHSHDNYEPDIPIKVNAGLSGVNARAVDEKWDSDNIGVSVISDTGGTMTNAANTNVQYSTTSTDVTATFNPVGSQGILFNADYDGTATFAAYAPYAASTSGTISLNTLQNNDTQLNQERNLDVIFATGATATAVSPTVSFVGSHAFAHQMVQLNLAIRTVKSNILTEDISAATAITLSGLKHTGTFNVTTGEINVTGSAVDAWDITRQYYTDDETGNVRTFSLILLPQQLSGNLSLSITIGGRTYTNAKLQPDLTRSGRAYNYIISVQGNTGITVEGSTITPWDVVNLEDSAYQE
jgi:hypothetical protein